MPMFTLKECSFHDEKGITDRFQQELLQGQIKNFIEFVQDLKLDMRYES